MIVDLEVKGSGKVYAAPMPDEELDDIRKLVDESASSTCPPTVTHKLLNEIDRLRFLQSLQQA